MKQGLRVAVDFVVQEYTSSGHRQSLLRSCNGSGCLGTRWLATSTGLALDLVKKVPHGCQVGDDVLELVEGAEGLGVRLFMNLSFDEPLLLVLKHDSLLSVHMWLSMSRASTLTSQVTLLLFGQVLFNYHLA